MNRREFLTAAAVAGTAARPNLVLIYCDDLGYGDIGCYGSRIRTPRLNRMAREGAKFRSFYSASPVCSPSRAALLTGRYPTRTGVPAVLFPDSPGGLSRNETTIASMLMDAGYRTACIGKWHLGTQPQFLPTQRGFGQYYGIPYSNDMVPSVLMQGTRIIESPVDLSTVTRRYTDQAVRFIQQAKGGPFFLYLAHTFPHIPLAVTSPFQGKSPLGIYGDVIEEIDWSTGTILDALAANGLDDNTLVIFTSDNGPWFQGSPGRLRGRKGDTFEGGMRVPCIARLPHRIPGGRVIDAMASTLDLLPTFARLSGASLSRNPLDGVDIWPLLSAERQDVERPVFLYFDNWNLQCARSGPYKLHMARYNTGAFTAEPVGGRQNLRLDPPELYDVDRDPSESFDCAGEYPDMVRTIRAQVDQMIPSFPLEVRTAWQEMLARAVNANVPGAWPSAPR